MEHLDHFLPFYLFIFFTFSLQGPPAHRAVRCKSKTMSLTLFFMVQLWEEYLVIQNNLRNFAPQFQNQQ